MWMERKKSNGKYYFYLYHYSNSTENLKELYLSLGYKEKALKVLNKWRLKKDIPHEILRIKYYRNIIKKWKNRIKECE